MFVPETIVEDYRKGDYGWPDGDIDPDLKRDPKFFYLCGQAILNEYFNNRSAIPYYWPSGKKSFAELRAYARGEEPIAKYQQILCPSKDSNKLGRNRAWFNINWDTVKIIPKFRDVIRGIAMNMDHDIVINAIDPTSDMGRKLEMGYLKLQADPAWQSFMKEVQQLGVPVQGPQQYFENEQQVDLYVESGGLKLGWEIGMKIALLATMYESKWEGIKDKVFDDLIDIAIAVTRNYVEPGTKKIKCRYVDPENFICSYSQYYDFRNISYAGELRMMSLSDIRKESELGEKEINEIARKYQSQYGNEQYFKGQGFYNTEYRKDFYQRWGRNAIDSFVVPVLDFTFVTSDISKYLKSTREESGNLLFSEVDFSYEYSKKDKKRGAELVEKRHEKIYKAKMILGTEAVFSYGVDDHIVLEGEDGNMFAEPPYRVYKTGTSSPVERAYPFADDINLATYKLRNAVAKLPPPPRVAIDKGVMENLTLGGVKMHPLDVFDLFQEDGYFIMQSLTDHQEPGMAANSSPVIPMAVGIAEDINIFTHTIEFNINQIRQVTGVNEIVDASNPNPRQGLGVAQMAAYSTNNTLKPIFRGYEVLFEETMRQVSKRWQSVLRNKDVRVRYKGLGQKHLEVFELTKDLSWPEYAITIDAAPTEQERDQLLQTITELRNVRLSQGRGGIGADTWLMLYRTIRSGNLELASLQLAIAIDEQQRKDREAELQMIRANGEEQRASNQQTVQNKLMEQQAKADSEAQLKGLEASIQKEQDWRRHYFEIEKIEKENEFESENK